MVLSARTSRASMHSLAARTSERQSARLSGPSQCSASRLVGSHHLWPVIVLGRAGRHLWPVIVLSGYSARPSWCSVESSSSRFPALSNHHLWPGIVLGRDSARPSQSSAVIVLDRERNSYSRRLPALATPPPPPPPPPPPLARHSACGLHCSAVIVLNRHSALGSHHRAPPPRGTRISQVPRHGAQRSPS
jgi:hypothetical protein